MYVVVRISDGKMVAREGMENSFTEKLTEAAVYKTEKKAAANCCGDEKVVSLLELTQPE